MAKREPIYSDLYSPFSSLSFITSSLHHHITTSLHHYITTSLHHYITTSLHHYITTSLHHYITTSLHHYITPSLHHTSSSSAIPTCAYLVIMPGTPISTLLDALHNPTSSSFTAMPAANTEITPKDGISTWFDALIADQHATGAASHPTECLIMDDIKSGHTPSCLLNHATFRKVDEIFREDPFRMMHLAQGGKAPFFKKESLMDFSPFEEPENIHETPETNSVVRFQRDPQSNDVYLFQIDPDNDSSYFLKIHRPGSEKMLHIVNDSNAKDPFFFCDFRDETSGMRLYSRPNAPQGQSISYSSVILSKNGRKRYLGKHEAHDDSSIGSVRITISDHSEYLEERNAGEVNISLKQLPSGPLVRLARQTGADGQTSIELKEGTHEDMETWVTKVAGKHPDQLANRLHSVAL